MALDHYAADSQLVDAYKKNVTDFLDGALHGDPVYIPVDSMGLESIRAGDGFDAAQTSGSRMYTVQPDGSVVSAELSHSEKGGAQVRGIHGGEITKRLVDSLRQAAESEEAAGFDFRVRLLTVPALRLEALRLACEDTQNDIIIPVVAGDARFRSKTLFRADEFLLLLREAAATRLPDIGEEVDYSLSS